MKTQTGDTMNINGLQGWVMLTIREPNGQDAGADMTIDECRQLIKQLQAAIVEAAR